MLAARRKSCSKSRASCGTLRSRSDPMPRTLTIHFQKYSPEGNRFKYSLRARFTTAHRVYHAHHFDWDLHAALKGLLETLGKRIQKEKERRMAERKRVRST